MQTTILIVTLALMAVTLFLILRVVLATEGPGPSESVGKIRSSLIWGMIIFGVVISIASLREWPNKTAGADTMVVNITGGQWWWETDTTEIPLGQEVEFRVSTEDVTHGLGIYGPDMRLVAQVQVMPEYTNSVVHTFDTPGTYQILCLEYCGLAHHDMVNEFDVVEGNS